MELELKKTCLDHYETGAELIWTQEDTAETIVPDYCPDIARIITANGCVYLRGREIRDGKAVLNGAVRVTVLYVPEKIGGIRALELTLPFAAESDRGSYEGCHALLAETQIEQLEIRMLNPRKIFTHCKLLHRAAGYRRSQLCYCSDVVPEEPHCLEKRVEKQSVVLLTSISEKDFTFTEEKRPSSLRCGVETLLCSQVGISVTEQKLVGSKLVFKGVFYVQLLYRGSDGMYGQLAEELPFSQIMEVEGPEEYADMALTLQLTGAEIQLAGEAEEQYLSVALYLHAAAKVWEHTELTLLTDLYSTAWETAYDAQTMELIAGCHRFSHRQTVREVLEMGGTAETLLAVWVQPGRVYVNREDTTVLRSGVCIRALALDESGSPLLAERRIDVTGQIDGKTGQRICVQAVCPESPQGVLGDHGVEIRFPLEFCVESAEPVKRICISAVRLNEDSQRDLSAVPSLVLRRLGQQESAWELAKSCNSTIADLLAANRIREESEIPRDRLLLIPRKRV